MLLPPPFFGSPEPGLSRATEACVIRLAKAWLEDGMPKDMSKYKQVFEESKAEVRQNPEAFKDHPDKDKPLGDESRDPTK
jgi:hypothetical protein